MSPSRTHKNDHRDTLIMVCPGCGCELSDLNPFSFCQICGEPIEREEE